MKIFMKIHCESFCCISSMIDENSDLRFSIYSSKSYNIKITCTFV